MNLSLLPEYALEKRCGSDAPTEGVDRIRFQAQFDHGASIRPSWLGD